MIASNKGLDFIKQWEGLYLKAYLDSASVPTIGWGSIMYKDGKRVKMGDTITLQQAQDLLAWEVNSKTSVVNSLCPNVNQNQFDALVSFTYNEGVGALQNSTLRKMINLDCNNPLIRNEFMKWNKVTVNGKKIVIEGLTNRRKDEADLYFTK